MYLFISGVFCGNNVPRGLGYTHLRPRREDIKIAKFFIIFTA
jgi:hypothetical protein